MQDIELNWKVVKENALPGKPIVNTLYDSRFDEGIFEYVDFPDKETHYTIEKRISFKIPNNRTNLIYHIRTIPKVFTLPSQYKSYISEVYKHSFKK